MSKLKVYEVSKLKTLKEHNENVLKIAEPDHHNGIECPECGEELIDTHPGIVLTSSPAQYLIGCENCNYTGTRY